MFALQLTETPVAAGAKGSRASEAPLAPAGAVKTDFQTHLGQAQTAVALPVAGSVVLPAMAEQSDAAAAILPLERLPRSQPGTPVALAETLPATPENLAEAGTAIPDPEAFSELPLPISGDSTDAPVAATPLAEELAGQPVPQDMEQIPTPSVSDQEADPARILSPDTETESLAAAPDLSPSDIPDDGLPQLASGIPFDQTVQSAEGPAEDSPTLAVTPPVNPGADPAEIPAMPTEGEIAAADPSEPITDAVESDLSSDTDRSGPDFGLSGVAAGTQTAVDASPEDAPARPVAPSPTTDTRAQAEVQPRLQTPEPQAGQDVPFSRVLTEVSVAAAPVTAPAQSAQQGSTSAQAQTLPPLDMSQPNWAEKLVEDVSLQPMGRGDTLTLTLTPERLGTMQVRLEMQDGQTHVHFITETPEAARLLTEAQTRLADLMSRAGVDLGSQSASTGQQGTQQNDHSAEGAPMQDGTAASAQDDTVADQSEAPARPSGSATRSTVDVVA